ncbi:hypothetical protein N656DRAFT_848851 [Canariomyces notabilis]|uniref:Uncharacterized protein n=1 Tax=Canariomyces notabilis TaxID=2074819 RepID=A0AAN6QEM8_9PEZI|nr:hypothetical protein N656DRAFT_848851 [Canariomyces arenarius]
MTSQHISATRPSHDAILNTVLETFHAYNASRPLCYVGLREVPPDQFEAVNAHFSAQVHAGFNALHDFGVISDASLLMSCPDPPNEGLWLTIRILKQPLDMSEDCMHRTFTPAASPSRTPDNLPPRPRYQTACLP